MHFQGGKLLHVIPEHRWCYFVGGEIGFVYGAAPAKNVSVLQPATARDRAAGPALQLSESFEALSAPATTIKLKRSLGPFSVASILRAFVAS